MKTHNRLTAVHRAALWITVAGLAAIVLAGCQEAGQLRSAQDAYNAGAALENQLRIAAAEPLEVSPEEATSVPRASIITSPTACYRAALDMLVSITDEASLRRDGLWVNKRTLEALCHWKLGHYDEAMVIAAETLQQADRLDGPRDRVILLALPGLIKIDQASNRLRSSSRDDPEQVYNEIDQLLFSRFGARPHLQDARSESSGRVIEPWVIQLQLAMHKTRLDAREELLGDDVNPEEVAVRDLLVDLKRTLADLGTSAGAIDGALVRWAEPFGIIPP